MYALDAERVLRIYRAYVNQDYVLARQRFYEQLAACQPDFAIPQVYSTSVIHGHPYTIERRMPGQDFARLLPHLTGNARIQALTSYLDLAARIGQIRLPDEPFGEIMLPQGAIRCTTWAEFAWERIQANIRATRDELAVTIPQLEQLLEHFHTGLDNLEPMHSKSLVHGDYFPGNVFIDQSNTVYGVGDFGYSSLVGDPRLDLVGAIVFLELVDGYQPDDTRLLLEHARRQGLPIDHAILDLYRTYYALYFSSCKDDDPHTYAWCIQYLMVFDNQNRYIRHPNP